MKTILTAVSIGALCAFCTGSVAQDADDPKLTGPQSEDLACVEAQVYIDHARSEVSDTAARYLQCVLRGEDRCRELLATLSADQDVYEDAYDQFFNNCS